MRKFGSECIVYEQNMKKLDPKGKKGIFIGFDRHSPAYLIYFPETKKVQKHRQAHFITKSVTESQTQTDTNQPEDHFIKWITTPSQTGHSQAEQAQPKEPDAELEIDPNSGLQPSTDTQTPRTTGRLRKKPQYLEDYECAVQSSELTIDYCYRVTVGLPQTFKEALAAPTSESGKRR